MAEPPRFLTTPMNVIESLLADAAAITALRREIHSHPELCFKEERTSDLVAAKLTEWGIPIRRGLGKTSVVGIIEGRAARGRRHRPARRHGRAADGRVQHLRARQPQPGRMHACGHDGHTAMLLAAAQHLAKHRDFDGIVYLLFQPAEEGGGGAREMIKDGLFTEFPMDAVFGMHNWPGIAVGQLAVCPGPCMASSNEFFITIRGRGSHAALPHLPSTRCPSPARWCRRSRPSSRATRSPPTRA